MNKGLNVGYCMVKQVNFRPNGNLFADLSGEQADKN